MEIREIHESEAEQFLSIAEENRIYFDKEELLSYYYQQKAKLWFAISSTGEPEAGKVLATCCSVSFEKRILISAVATPQDFYNSHRVYQELLNFVIERGNNKILDVVLPEVYTASVMRGNDQIGCKVNCEINLYSYDAERIRQSSATRYSEYKLSSTNQGQYIVCMSYLSSIGEERAIVKILPKHKTQYVYQLGLKRSVVGYGVLFKVNENIWVIGPLVAHSAEGAKCLLNEILSDAQRRKIKGQVFIYTLNSNLDAGNLLDEAGFVRSRRQWTFYHHCQVPCFFCSYDPQVNDIKRIYFGINSTVFSSFTPSTGFYILT